MKTLVFCTAYARTASDWSRRYRQWLRAVNRPALAADTILIIDDGSETLPGWPGVALHSGNSLADAARLPARPGVMLYHFAKPLGRADIFDFPGWHRSFAFGALFGEAGDFDRVIHIESDAHLISDRAHIWFREFAEGWASLWSARYNFPEIALQVAAGRGVGAMADFARQPYDALRGAVHEDKIPFTHVERNLTGERYGEDLDQVPSDADYVAQVQTLREPTYYWWLEGRLPNTAPPLIDWHFGHSGNMAAPLGDGWAAAEAEHRWMLGLESIVLLPNLPARKDFTLLLTVIPHVRLHLIRQRLILFVNDAPVGEYEVTQTSYLGFRLPSGPLRRDGTDRLRLLHPDGRPPSAISDHPDRRWLSLALVRLRIFVLS